MHPEECGKIAEKWAPQLAQGRGLVGWLLPRKPTSAAGAKSATNSAGVIHSDATTGHVANESMGARPSLDEIDYLTDLERYR